MTLVAALALAACRQDAPEAPAPKTEISTAPAPQAGPAAAPTETSAEVDLESLLGIWRVVAVLPGEGAAFKVDDPRIVGALMDVSPEQLAWSYKPSGDFAPPDLCLGPVAGLIARPDIADDARTALRPARVRASPKAKTQSQPHHWLCGDGGEWGDEAEFQLIGREHLAMLWPGGLALLLERIRRTSGDAPELPPTGAFEPR